MIFPEDTALVVPWWIYAGSAFFFSGLIRLLLTFFRCYRLAAEHGGGIPAFLSFYWRTLVGIGYKPVDLSADEAERKRVRGDYLTAFVLGGIELMAYPVLFAAGLDIYVGVWLGAKIAAQYRHWSEDRGAFAVFLVGNALVLIVAFVFLQGFIGSTGNV
jgi:hypothetical protein